MPLRRQLRLLQLSVIVLACALVFVAAGLDNYIAALFTDRASDAADKAMAQAEADMNEAALADAVTIEPPPEIDADYRIRRLEIELAATRRMAGDAASTASQAQDRADEAYAKAMEPCLVYSQFC